MKRILCLLCILALVAALMAACGKNDPASPASGYDQRNDVPPGGAAGDFLPQSEIEGKLSNYRITFRFTDTNGSEKTITEMRCAEGYSLLSDGALTFVDFSKNNQYILDTKDKTGTAVPLMDDEMYRSFSIVMGGFLFGFEGYRDLGLARAGSDTVIGRKTTVYSIQVLDAQYKFWVDDEYGVTLKSSIGSSGAAEQVSQVTEFKVGGITLADMADLSAYKVEDLSSIMR